MRGKTSRVLIPTGYGLGAHRELAEAFRLAGAHIAEVHLSDFLDRPGMLSDYTILALPGGFSYGDHLGAGMVLAGLLKRHLRREIEAFVDDGRLVLGVGNGFQVLVKMGLLPRVSGDLSPQISLVHNESGLFQNRWVSLRTNPANPSPWIQGLDRILLPIRHGEGRFVTRSPEIARQLQRENLIAFFYDPDNPDGSEMDVAGLSDPSGRVLGMMPHPEGFLFPQNHPRWSREGEPPPQGRRLFQNGVDYAASL